MIPWTFDALLDAEHRYTSLKFRRASPRVYPTRLDYADAAELCAFVRTIGGVKYARWIFNWTKGTIPHVDQLLTHMDKFPDVARMVAENQLAVDRSDGLKCLRAMKDGGWRQGSVPGIVRMAMLDMRKDGLSMPKIGLELGLSVDQVNNVCNTGRGKRPQVQGLAGLWAV